MSLQRYPMHADALGPFKAVYLAVLQSIHSAFGIDPTLIIEGALGLTAAATFIHYAGGSLWYYAKQFYVSSVQIQEGDMLYGHMMHWVTDHELSSFAFRSARATTHFAQNNRGRRRGRGGRIRPIFDYSPIATPGGELDEDDEDEYPSLDEEFDPDRIISYRSIMGRERFQLQPFQSSHYFRHQGSWIRFSQQRVHVAASHMFPEARDMGSIHLECLGRSLKPIEALLTDVQMYSLEHCQSQTIVFRALSTHGMPQWFQVVSRPSRDIKTVILDKAKKHALLKDINEYLHPRTRRWYSNHGIPYRRGYLFYGAPGTGKTSLASAIAGIFGLNIYVLSLLDPSMTESHLTTLMSQVPSHCILLLEDIDAAGLGKRTDVSSSTASQNQAQNRPPRLSSDEPWTLPDGTIAIPPTPSSGTPGGISLSALLNAIDGVASNEGRVLIMTTNSPDTLDAALIRPGRIDMRVHFDLPSRAEIEELFLSMYSDEVERQKKAPEPSTSPHKDSSSSDDHATTAEDGEVKVNGAAIVPSAAAENDDDDAKGKSISSLTLSSPGAKMQAMATSFSDALPEGKLNLADIQGFMLGHKRDPVAACRLVGEWASERLRGVEGGNRNGKKDKSGEKGEEKGGEC